MPAGQDLARDAVSPAGPHEASPGDIGHDGSERHVQQFPASAGRRSAVGDGYPPDERPARQFPVGSCGRPAVGDGYPPDGHRAQRFPASAGHGPAATDGCSLDRRRAGPDRPTRWLTASMLSLGVLAAASAVVSYSAQYRMVLAAKADVPVAALEAGIPDVAALIFATLGIALALHGKRAIRARALNVGAVATSITMNVLAAGPGWRDLAIWAMRPVAYALASDTAIGVVRAWTIARHQQARAVLTDDGPTPLALLGGLVLWLFRLILAPASTLAGFRAWVLEECPVAPGRRARRAMALCGPQ
jgi:hypothetical protein